MSINIKDLLRALHVLILALFFVGSIQSQENEMSEYDTIVDLLNKVKNGSQSDIEKLSFAQNAKNLALNIENDTLYNLALRYVALYHFRLDNQSLFKMASEEFLETSTRVNDSAGMARAYRYLGEYYYKKFKSDSAYYFYYNSEKIYNSLNDFENLVKIMAKVAIIQKNEKDFSGSEATVIEALELYDNLEENITQASLFNTMGIVYNELGQYQESIKYHEKALRLRKKFGSPDGLEPEFSYNNMAVAYKNDQQYQKALDNFNLVLENNSAKSKDPSFYAMVLGNFAHTKFLLNQTEELPGLFHDAIKINDSLFKIKKSVDKQYNNIAIYIHLSEYYDSLNQSDSAKYYALKAKTEAKRFANDDYLKALMNLTKIEEDSLSVKYYREYIALNDSLLSKEREIRNKFARIRYETKEIELRNERITKERLYLLILSIGLLLTIFLTYSTISQRAKNKELKLKQLQQEANEEIYNLMLSQQDKIEEGRTKEKKRISEELHDGILGRLFGTRLSLDSLNKSIGEDAIENRSVYIEELKSIEQEIRKISHDLSSDFVEGSSYFDIVKTLVENQTQAYQLSYQLKKNDDIDWENVSNKTKINLYRIVQESLQNIYKHANANHVSIDFDSVNESIVLEIKDDGSGFDVSKSRKGIGLKNIKSRTEEVKGEISIKSEREQGTTIKVKVPK